MRRQSKAKAAEGRARRTLRARLYDERGLACEICEAAPWTDMHERKTRARGGSPLNPDNLLCLCRKCHATVTTNPEWAEGNDFMRHSWDDE